MSCSLIQGVLPIVNIIDQETEKEARAHKGCRAIQEEDEEEITSSFIIVKNIRSNNGQTVVNALVPIL
jgi:hypothetical protein